MSVQQVFRCSSCGKNLPQGAKACPYCGASFVQAPVPPSDPICPGCGMRFQNLPNFCPGCGHLLIAYPQGRKRPLPPSLVALLIVAGLFGLCLLAGVTGYVSKVLRRDSKEMLTVPVGTQFKELMSRYGKPDEIVDNCADYQLDCWNYDTRDGMVKFYFSQQGFVVGSRFERR